MAMAAPFQDANRRLEARWRVCRNLPLLAWAMVVAQAIWPMVGRAQAAATTTPPKPQYHWQSQGLNLNGPWVADPAVGKSRLEAAYAQFEWWPAVYGNQTAPLYCTATAEVFTMADFKVEVAGAYYSSRASKNVQYRTGICTAGSYGGPCTGWGCAGTGSTTYSMQALCPNGWVFEARGGRHFCEALASSRHACCAASRLARPAALSFPVTCGLSSRPSARALICQVNSTRELPDLG